MASNTDTCPPASRPARGWKQHTCYGCGDVYRYALEPPGRHTAPPALTALGLVERKDKVLKDAVAVRPCPTCGTVQPDMYGLWRVGGHALAALLSQAAAGVLLALTLTGSLPGGVTALAGA